MPKKKTRSLKDFEDKYGGSNVKRLEEALQSAIGKRAPLVVNIPSEKNTITFGLYGDTQFGNIYEATEEYQAYLERLKKEGITTKLHTGDVFDGHNVYRGQEYDLHAMGWARQKAHFLKTEPVIKGMKTYFITGNHDASFKRNGGVDVGTEIADARKDWNFIGDDQGEIVLRTENGRDYKVRLTHPGGGTAYAISYKSQKQAEALEGGSKPDMVGIGHYHKAEYLPHYRNVCMIQTGCFEWQTPFMARMPTPAHVGGWIIRATVGSKKSMSNSIQAEFISFYKKPAIYSHG